MGNSEKETETWGGWKIVGCVGAGVVGLTVTFFSPQMKKLGEDFAGVSSPDQTGKPAVIVVQTPVPAAVVVQSPVPAAVVLQTPVPAAVGETRSPDSPGGGRGSTATVVVVQTPVPVFGGEAQKANTPPREPRVTRNTITVPRFENTEQADYLESSGTGSSTDRESAIFKALEEALSKQGARFTGEVRLKLLAETTKLNESKVRRVEQSVASDFTRLSGGLLRWWDIRSEEDDGVKCTVEVLAVVAKIKAQAADHPTRKTLAVLPFQLDGDARLNDRVVPANTIGNQLREAVVTYLVNSRKFAVLDKTFTEELDRLIGQNPAADPVQRAIDAARKLGAQYAVIGLVDGLSVERRRVGPLDVPSVDGMVSLRIIELSSRQTVLASAFPLATLSGLDLGGNRPENSIADALGRAMSDRTLETIYPFKVAALNGPDEVILNRGGDLLSVGERFDLFNPGEEIKDPSTGESLGAAERKIGTVEVISVKPKVSYAKVITKTENIMLEAVCRKPQQATADGKTKTAPIRNEIDNLFK
jgi:hypothetical protein